MAKEKKEKKPKKKKGQPETLAAESLTLTNAAGAEIISLPPALVSRYRQMHTRVFAEDDPKKIGIVSALQGEGVTSVTLGFAAVMAQDLELKICLVEANWWWQGLAKMAKIEPEPGLAQVMKGDVKLQDALRKTSLENLNLLPAGNSNGHARGRMARSTVLSETLEKLTEDFDLLLLDIPPLHASDDAAPIAAHVDAIYLVVRQGITPISMIKAGLDAIEHLPVKGVVLNGDQVSIPTWLKNLIPGA
jgi:Mrp family chromosome partitioning ATPase